MILVAPVVILGSFGALLGLTLGVLGHMLDEQFKKIEEICDEMTQA